MFEDPLLAWPFFAFVGLVSGSFMTVVVVRLPASLPFFTLRSISGRSSCPACGMTLGIVDIIPLLSWLWLRGRCRHCHAPVPSFYPLTELACALLFPIAASQCPDAFSLIAAGCLTWFLLALALIDCRTCLLPDVITLPLLWMGLLIPVLQHQAADEYILGAVAGYLAFWGVYQAYRLIRRKEGMGYGDFKLCAALGAWSGWQALPLICLWAALLGLAWVSARAISGRKNKNHPIAFGPCLCAAGWVVIIFMSNNP